MHPFSDKQFEDILNACKTRHVKNLYLFGSILTERFQNKSDVDFLVEFHTLTPEDYSDSYFDLCEELEKILGRKVDLVTINSIKNPYFKESVFSTRQKLFPVN